ncbi:MAG TPA: hypothetical protein VMT03_04915 [Polyangia bacterium]|nr:hypothetical protein [Polyangia bacterium]
MKKTAFMKSKIGSGPSPREFMRARRPEQFSDSVEENENVLDRTLLEFELSTLGARRQEVAFETFARKLSEKVLCPNLTPHSGPDAGGDSKTDSETYPVSPKIAAAWYVGTPSESGAERWAFAFSTQKTWKAKVRDDVRKIAETGRGYAKAIFVSSEAIRDKDRSAAEDGLRKEFGIDVRILDRAWILNEVFKAKLEDLAVEELQISTNRKRSVRKGPNDTARAKELAAIEERIAATLAASAAGPHVVFDCIDAAVLARELEKPRAVVDGMFMRAHRLAGQHGTRHQQIVALYENAWTAYWWYEDFTTFNALHAQVETLAQGSQNFDDLERLNTLWSLARTAIAQGRLGEAETKIAERTATLVAELQRIASDEERPSASLQAKTSLALMRVHPEDPQATDAAFGELRQIVLSAMGLVGYPLKRLVRLLSEFGDLPSLPGYEALMETIVEVATKRDGDVAGGRILLDRGVQQLKQDKPYDAIRTLGRALSRLYKHETKREVTTALFFCGLAYEQVDLLWAARGSTLMAASVAVQEFWSREKITLQQADCFNRMKWLELRLGRVTHALAWHELDRAARASLAARGYDAERLFRGEESFDALLGLLFLRAEPDCLKDLARLPDALDEADLPRASMALMYALGHEEGMNEPATADAAAVDAADLLLKWRELPAGADIAAAPNVMAGPTAELSSYVLGCKITCAVENTSPCTELAESLLAAVEALLATALQEGIAAKEPRLYVDIRRGDMPEGEPFTFEFSEKEGYPHLKMTCGGFVAQRMPPELQTKVKERLSDVIPHLIARTFIMRDVEGAMTKLFRDDRANDRAGNFTSSFVVLGNVMGDSSRLSLGAWTGGKEYPLRRKERWDATLAPPSAQKAAEEADLPTLDGNGMSHRKIETVSPIRLALWERAGWTGAAFMRSAMMDAPPVFAPIFADAAAAKEIFVAWRNELGEDDQANVIRVTIIRGIDAANPTWYRVVIGSNIDAMEPRPGHLVIMTSRLLTCTPQTSENLDGFLARFSRVGRYFLAPAVLKPGSPTPDFLFDYAITKRQVNVRNAWEIGRHDPDSGGISADDSPIIPATPTPAPVAELLTWKRERGE